MRSLLLLLLVAACENPDNSHPGGDLCTMPGYVCASPDCSQFPLQPGCDYVQPSDAYCPFDRPHCFDPSRAPGYCDPALAKCAKAKTSDASCVSPLCTVEQVKACYDTNDLLFCKDGYSCVHFGCMDGGVSDGGKDADSCLTSDMCGPVDMSMPVDLPNLG